MKAVAKVVPFVAASLLAVSLAGCASSGTPTGQSSDAQSSGTAATVSQATGGTADDAAQSTSDAAATAFPQFTGTDFDGNAVDNTIFSKSKLTVLNFWFNDCSACVGEMPALQELNDTLAQMGAQVVGVNVEASGGDDALAEAKEKLASQGATYTNIMVTGGDEALSYIDNIYAFPTTVLVDRDGNVVGEPTLGSVEDPDVMQEILDLAKSVCAQDSAE